MYWKEGAEREGEEGEERSFVLEGTGQFFVYLSGSSVRKVYVPLRAIFVFGAFRW